VLIDAVAAAVREGADLELVLAGEGKYRPEFERRAATLGLGARARFLGQVPYGAGVREVLDRADLFVLPSRSEGLPRAIIEAMARGLPCIGSTVSGIPELLPAEDLVPPDDVPALTAKIREVLGDRARMQRMSVRNLAKAEDYREELLRARRRAFYRSLRETTERWLHEHGQAVASEGRQKAA
jgi:glycosyltransferase involved in cell wall biosynthesis